MNLDESDRAYRKLARRDWRASSARGTRLAIRASSLLALGAALPSQAQDIVPPKIVMTTPGGANIADGRFSYSATDISIGTLTLERFTFDGATRQPNDPFFGNAMTHNFDIYVVPTYLPERADPFTARRYHTIVHVGASASGTYVQPYYLGSSSSVSEHNREAYSTRLQWVSGAYVYTDHTGAVYTFDPSVQAGGTSGALSQRVSNIVFPDGRVQTFSYNSNDRLQMVSDTAGFALIFKYNSNGDVTEACGFNLSQTYVTTSTTCASAPLKTAYGYSSTALVSATDVMGETTTYSGTCITPPGYTTCKVTTVVNSALQVIQQTLHDGSVWLNTPADVGLASDPDYAPGNCDTSASVTDPKGKVTNYTFTKTSPCSVVSPDGKITYYEWTGGSLLDSWVTPVPEGNMLVRVTMPEGDKYEREYSNNNDINKEILTSKSGSSVRVKEYKYPYQISPYTCTPQNCSKPLWIKDPKGNQTDYTYTSWGAMTSEMQPAPVSGAARPLKLFTYIQKYAYVKNSGGTLVQAAAQTWLPETETLCQTATGSSPAATCDTGAPITVTTYEYGANGVADNLLQRGKVVTSGGVSLRTCYTYDTLGRKVSETSPRGTTTSVCS